MAGLSCAFRVRCAPLAVTHLRCSGGIPSGIPALERRPVRNSPHMSAEINCILQAILLLLLRCRGSPRENTDRDVQSASRLRFLETGGRS